jgi:ribosomal protein S19
MNIKKSGWKFPFSLNTFSHYYKKEKKIYNRNITLTTSFLNKKIDCYKGLNTGKLIITKNHLGHKLGEFFITKVLGERIAYRKKLKLLLKRKKNKINLKKK